MSTSDNTPSTELVTLAESGFGYGDGAISVRAQMERGEVDAIAIRAAQDRMVFSKVQSDDDGCGDGREAIQFYIVDTDSGKTKTLESSSVRAKLFGGGLVVATSMWCAVRGPNSTDRLSGDRLFIADELASRNIHFGAHTDTHSSTDLCGCGAIDKYDVITATAVKYRGAIMEDLKTLYGDSYSSNEAVIKQVFEIYERIAHDDDYFDVNGHDSMEMIKHRGALIKQLGGDHMEDLVVINLVDGTTLDQARLRERLREDGYSPNIQAFTVDVWRGDIYARVVAEIAKSNGLDSEMSYKTAYADFFIRTLATSATLTAGDQPVVLHKLSQI